MVLGAENVATTVACQATVGLRVGAEVQRMEAISVRFLVFDGGLV